MHPGERAPVITTCPQSSSRRLDIESRRDEAFDVVETPLLSHVLCQLCAGQNILYTFHLCFKSPEIRLSRPDASGARGRATSGHRQRAAKSPTTLAWRRGLGLQRSRVPSAAPRSAWAPTERTSISSSTATRIERMMAYAESGSRRWIALATSRCSCSAESAG